MYIYVLCDEQVPEGHVCGLPVAVFSSREKAIEGISVLYKSAVTASTEDVRSDLTLIKFTSKGYFSKDYYTHNWQIMRYKLDGVS